MLYQDLSREDFLPNTNQYTQALSSVVNYDWKGYGGFSFDVIGTISAGYLKVQGSTDGNTWTDIFTVQNGSQVPSNQITSGTIPGHFTCNVIGFQQGRIIGQNSFAGNAKITSVINVLTPPEVANVLGGP